jgi:hypothetical protein
MSTPELSWGVCDDAMPTTISAMAGPSSVARTSGALLDTLKSVEDIVNDFIHIS